jgi:hypothetical protein
MDDLLVDVLEHAHASRSLLPTRIGANFQHVRRLKFDCYNIQRHQR